MDSDQDYGRQVVFDGVPGFIYKGKDEFGRVLLHGPHAGCSHDLTCAPFNLCANNWHFEHEPKSN